MLGKFILAVTSVFVDVVAPINTNTSDFLHSVDNVKLNMEKSHVAIANYMDFGHFAASNYGLNEDFQSREFLATGKIEYNGPANSHKYSEEQLHQVPASEQVLDDNFDVQLNGSLQGTMNSVPDHLSSPIEEPVVEPQKHTYASIVRGL